MYNAYDDAYVQCLGRCLCTMPMMMPMYNAYDDAYVQCL